MGLVQNISRQDGVESTTSGTNLTSIDGNLKRRLVLNATF